VERIIMKLIRMFFWGDASGILPFSAIVNTWMEITQLSICMVLVKTIWRINGSSFITPSACMLLKCR